MTAADSAFRVADRLKIDAPWEVYGERIRRFEVHLNGTEIEMVRGPIALEGYGLRVFRSKAGKTGTGFQASTDLSDAGVKDAAGDAESVARNSEFPTAKVVLPTGEGHPAPASVIDQRLWDDPLGVVEGYVAEIGRGFAHRTGVAPSFGSIRATLSETSIANSAGLRTAYPHTTVEFEIAVKSFGGAEGAPPGEYWVNELTRRLDPTGLSTSIDDWCKYAADGRHAKMPPTGDLPVVLPVGVLSGILPPVIGFRFTGAARLRKIAPMKGDALANSTVSIHDDGVYAWSPSTGPVDGEGATRATRPLIAKGAVAGLLYDALHAGAFDVASTASATRATNAIGYTDWRQFSRPPSLTTSTISVAPGDGGTDAELIEAAGDGIWVQQLGWAVPDPISGAFGGEIRIGYRIRNGKLGEPVRGGTVGGTVMAPPGKPSLLQNIAAIGSKSSLAERVASPTLLVRPLTVAGA